MHSISTSTFFSHFNGFPSVSPNHIRLYSAHVDGKHMSAETQTSEPGFVEVGYISNSHGVRGEVFVKPSTDFSELRFATPGRRWLRQSVSSKDFVKEVKLLEGRENPGQKTWILRLEGVDSVEQAKQLVGSTILVREDDRPELDEGEYYSRDLIGMRVVLQDSDVYVGAVVNVFDNRGTDLLQVMLHESPRPGHLIWIPFVEAIVPVVDLNRRELKITPPKGLLELNFRSDQRPKKERRQLEWKERKRLQRRLLVVKKKLGELQQMHVFDGLKLGDKSQRSALAEQIAKINVNLLQLALQTLPPSSHRPTDFLASAKPDLVKRYLKISRRSHPHIDENAKIAERGANLIAGGKLAIALLVDSSDHAHLERFLGYLFQVDDRSSVPLILVCDDPILPSLTRLFETNDHFGFDCDKVEVVRNEKLPLFRRDGDKYEIAMKSSMEIMESSIGSAGVVFSLSSDGILQKLSDAGVQYIEVCTPSGYDLSATSMLLGMIHSSASKLGFLRQSDVQSIILSVESAMAMAATVENFPLEAAAVPPPESAKPDDPLLFEFRCTLAGAALRFWSPRDLCVMHVTD